MKKKALRIFFGVAAGLLALVFFIRITKVQFSGNTRYTSEQLESIIFRGSFSKNTLYAWIQSMVGRKIKIPFVQDYTVEITGPGSAEVIIYEKSMVGCISYMDSYMYFDKDGIVVESANRILEGIPVVEGLDFSNIVLYEALPVENKEVFHEILNLTQVLTGYNISVERIKILPGGKALLYVDEIEVDLGDNKDINGKLGELKDILPELQRRGEAGTLYLDSYDRNKDKSSYYFKRR